MAKKRVIARNQPFSIGWLRELGVRFFAPFDIDNGSNAWTPDKGWVGHTTMVVDPNGTFVSPSSGLVHSKDGQPRIERFGILIEPPSENLQIHSEDTSEWEEQNLGSNTANTNIAPDGTLTADTLEDDRVDAQANIRFTSAGISDPDRMIASMHILKTVNAASHPGIRLNMGGADRFSVGMNSDTGLVQSSAVQVPAELSTSDAKTYWRVSVTTETDGTPIFIVHPAVTTDGGDTWFSSITGTSVVWGFMLETVVADTRFPMSYIPTLGSTVTRNADDIDYLITNEDIVRAADGTIGGVVTPFENGSVMPADEYVFDFTTANDGILGFFDQSNGGKFTVIVTSGGGTIATLVAATAPSSKIPFTFFVTWRAAKFTLYMDGVPVAEVAVGAAPVEVGTHLFVGQTRGNASPGRLHLRKLITLASDPGAGVIGQLTRDMAVG